MKHIVSIALVSTLFGATSLVAVESASLSVKNNTQNTLQKNEMEMLFGKDTQNLNAEILTEKEMQETKGEFWAGLGAGLLVLAVDKYGQKKGWW